MPRQRSAKFTQSTLLRPCAFPKSCPSRVMLERQSTTVPNTSKVSALIDAGSKRAMILSPLVERGALLLPGPRLLEGGRGLEHGEVGEAAPHDLQSHGQTRLGEARRNGAGGLTGEVEGIGEGRPAEPVPRMLRPALRIDAAERQGGHGHRRRQQEVVLLEERAHRGPVDELMAPRFEIMHHALLRAVLD